MTATVIPHPAMSAAAAEHLKKEHRLVLRGTDRGYLRFVGTCATCGHAAGTRHDPECPWFGKVSPQSMGEPVEPTTPEAA